MFLFSFTLHVFAATEVYFSPGGGIRDQIIRRINVAHTSIDVAVYSFTADDIARALVNAHKRGVKIRVIRDKSQSADKHDENQFLIDQGIEVQIRSPRGRGIMHDKFAIFDQKEAFTGSYNWTNNAEMNNWENALFIDDKNAVDSYKKEFDKLWHTPFLNTKHSQTRKHH